MVAVPSALALLLGGCSTLSSINPVNWWHDLEGGKIAERRPPPPGADDADPNLGTVPARPTPPDRAAMDKLTKGLIADREHAQYANAANPMADPSSPTASPSLFGTGTLPPPAPAAPAAISASVPAASAPAAPPTPAPVKPVQSAPLAAPEAVPTIAPETAPMPQMPEAPPPRPAVAPEAVAPLPPPAAPIAAAPVPASTDAVTVSFEPASAEVNATTKAAVTQIAARRKGATIVLTGYGDATSSDPAAQDTALRLALGRASALAAAFKAAGVPETALQIGGEAAGRGASIRLLH